MNGSAEIMAQVRSVTLSSAAKWGIT
jgi:hypothetical protein